MDLNRHVTSSRYVDWLMDTFPVDFHQSHYPRQLSINYLKEVLPAQRIRLSSRQADIRTHTFEGINETLEQPSYRALIRF